MTEMTKATEADEAPLWFRLGYLTTVLTWVAAGGLLLVPYGFICLSLDELFGYGWPGPWLNDMAALNGGEALLGLHIGSALAALVLVPASVVVAVNAHRTKTHPVLSVLVGLLILTGAAVALFPLATTPSGQL